MQTKDAAKTVPSAWWQTGIVSRISTKRKAKTRARNLSLASSASIRSGTNRQPSDYAWHADSARASIVVVLENHPETGQWMKAYVSHICINQHITQTEHCREFVGRLLIAGLRCSAFESSTRDRVSEEMFQCNSGWRLSLSFPALTHAGLSIYICTTNTSTCGS